MFSIYNGRYTKIGGLMIEQSYVMVKPEFAQYPRAIYEIARRLERNGLDIDTAGYIKYDKERAQQHYGKSLYPDLEKYITSDLSYGMIVEGENAIAVIKELVGSTKDPAPGTIRYDIPKMLGLERRITENVVHVSDSKQAAEHEIGIFKELFSGKTHSKPDREK